MVLAGKLWPSGMLTPFSSTLSLWIYCIISFNRKNFGVSSSSVHFDNEKILAKPVVARGELHHDAVRVAAVVELAPGQAATRVRGQHDLVCNLCTYWRAEGSSGLKVLCTVFCNLHSLPFLSPSSGVQISKQYTHWTFDPINNCTPVPHRWANQISGRLCELCTKANLQCCCNPWKMGTLVTVVLIKTLV